MLSINGISFVALMKLLFGSVLFASALVFDSTNNTDTFLESNESILNYSIVNESTTGNSFNQEIEAINLSPDSIEFIDVETLTSINMTLSETGIEAEKNETPGFSANETIVENISTNTTYFQPLELEVNLSNISIPLAGIFDEEKLEFDRSFMDKYLKIHGNFSNLEFRKIISENRGVRSLSGMIKERQIRNQLNTDAAVPEIKDEFVLKTGAKNENLKGYEIGGRKFAIHALSCSHRDKSCIFRINGVPTKSLKAGIETSNSEENSFQIDDNQYIKIQSVEIDQCDNKRFCNLAYEGYDVLHISIEGK